MPELTSGTTHLESNKQGKHKRPPNQGQELHHTEVLLDLLIVARIDDGTRKKEANTIHVNQD
jgi:hypothetical protein